MQMKIREKYFKSSFTNLDTLQGCSDLSGQRVQQEDAAPTRTDRKVAVVETVAKKLSIKAFKYNLMRFVIEMS